MKMRYEKPMMYMEKFISEQYVAASDCGTPITVTPSHGHVNTIDGEWHCAFTSSNCGEKATSCLAGQTTSGCETITGTHEILTEESGSTKYNPRENSYSHHCHILSDNDAAVSFVNTYTDQTCGTGVAKLMGLQDFEDIEAAWS